MVRVFISYRREDCAGYAGRLYDDLREMLPESRLTMDVDAIEPGTNFEDFIRHEVDSCDVLLAIIGPRWLVARDRRTRARRLKSSTDWVRIEIEAALRRDRIKTIPVLVQGAPMPKADQLPENLKALSNRQALELSDSRWRDDVKRLADILGRRAVHAYNPDTPVPTQTQGWTSAGATVHWLVQSIDFAVSEEELYHILVPEHISAELGLLAMDLSGVGSALRSLGLDASSGRVEFDEVLTRAGRQPLMLSLARWPGATVGHHVGVRRLTQGPALSLANPMRETSPFGAQTLGRTQFESGPVWALWIDVPVPQPKSYRF
jgi:hypothetical protein